MDKLSPHLSSQKKMCGHVGPIKGASYRDRTLTEDCRRARVRSVTADTQCISGRARGVPGTVCPSSLLSGARPPAPTTHRARVWFVPYGCSLHRAEPEWRRHRERRLRNTAGALLRVLPGKTGVSFNVSVLIPFHSLLHLPHQVRTLTMTLTTALLPHFHGSLL